jgi:ribosome maturation factor RimP
VGLTPTFFVGGRFIKKMRSARSTSPEPETPRAALTPLALTPEIESELAEIASATGCELVHVEWKGGVLRLILDRPEAPATAPSAPRLVAAESGAGVAADAPAPPAPPAAAGVSLGDCEQVAKQASALLDLLEFGNGRYVLEVSSPGLDRELYRPSDYQRFVGRLARVTFEAPGGPGGRPAKRTVVARLAGAAPAAGGGNLEVTLADDSTGERFTLGLDSIRRARLEIEI